MGQQIEFALRQSTQRAVLVLGGFLPGLLAFLVAVIVMALAGWLLAMLVRRLLTAMHFDERLSARVAGDSPYNLADWSPGHSPTLLASRVTLWAFLFIGLIIGISAFDAFFAANSRVSFFFLPYVTHVIGAMLLLIAGNLIARFLARTVLIGAVNAQLQYARFLSLGIKWLVLVLAAAMALDHLGIGGAIVELAFGILFGGIVLTLALAIGLGSRDLVSRSIEKTMEKAAPPAASPVTSMQETDAARSKLRHF